MLDKIVILLLVCSILWMIYYGGCSPHVLREGMMPYLPTAGMCDATPEYWPEVCSAYAAKRDANLSKHVGKEMCCGASPGRSLDLLKRKHLID